MKHFYIIVNEDKEDTKAMGEKDLPVSEGPWMHLQDIRRRIQQGETVYIRF